MSGGKRMRLGQIMGALAAFPLSGGAAEEQARYALLEWALDLPPDADYRAEARHALARKHSFIASSDAVARFVGHLRMAADLPPVMPARRRGAASGRRVLH